MEALETSDGAKAASAHQLGFGGAEGTADRRDSKRGTDECSYCTTIDNTYSQFYSGPLVIHAAQNVNSSKMEKADILELAVSHLRLAQSRDSGDSGVLSRSSSHSVQ